MNIAWLTVNYWQDDYVFEWAKSIPSSGKGTVNQLFVVDNSNSLKNHGLGRPVSIMSTKDNFGYFGGFNHCLEAININDFDYVVFSNPDIVFAGDFMQELLAIAKTQAMPMVVAPRITTTDGNEQNPNAAIKISRLKKFYYKILFSCYPAFSLLTNIRKHFRSLKNPVSAIRAPQVIYMPHGACFVVSRDFFSHYDRLDDRVFLWGEEALLRKQVHDAGGEIWFWPKLRVLHHEHTSTGKIPTKKKFELMQRSFKVYEKCL